MDSRAGSMDNIFIELFWRTVKYRHVYRNDYAVPRETWQGIGSYLRFYCYERPHQALSYKRPLQVYREGKKTVRNERFFRFIALRDISRFKTRGQCVYPGPCLISPGSALGSLLSVALSSDQACYSLPEYNFGTRPATTRKGGRHTSCNDSIRNGVA